MKTKEQMENDILDKLEAVDGSPTPGLYMHEFRVAIAKAVAEEIYEAVKSAKAASKW